MADRPLDIRRLTVSTAVVTLATATNPINAAPGIPQGARSCLIKVVGDGVRFAVGADPTAANGFPLDVGDRLIDVAPGTDLRFIRSGAADATLEIIFTV